MDKYKGVKPISVGVLGSALGVTCNILNNKNEPEVKKNGQKTILMVVSGLLDVWEVKSRTYVTRAIPIQIVL